MPSGKYMSDILQVYDTLHVACTVYLCAVEGSQNQLLFPLNVLFDWPL